MLEGEVVDDLRGDGALAAARGTENDEVSESASHR